MQSRSRLLRCAATSYVEKNSVYASVTSLRLRRRYGRVDSEPVGPAPSKPVGRFRAAIEPEDLIEVKVRGFHQGQGSSLNAHLTGRIYERNRSIAIQNFPHALRSGAVHI